MPGFNKNRIRFRPLESSDAAYISRWLADTLRQPPGWERQFLKTLLDEWERTAKLSRETSWMAMYGKQRLFFLELAGEEDVFLTAPNGLLNNRIIALAAWRRAVVHLRNLGTPRNLVHLHNLGTPRNLGRLPGIRVTLDKSREVECDCLLELGFTEAPPDSDSPPNGSQNHRIFTLNWSNSPLPPP